MPPISNLQSPISNLTVDPLKKYHWAITQLLIDEPFYATLALRLKPVLDPSVGTACTNGREVRLAPEFIATLQGRELNTVIAEEVMHNALGHLWRLPAAGDPREWNRACDQVIRNLMLDENEKAKTAGPLEPFPIPGGESGPYYPDRAFKGQAEEVVYASLMARKAQGDAQDQPQPQGHGKGQSQGDGPRKPSPGPSPGQGPGKAPGKGQADPNGHSTSPPSSSSSTSDLPNPPSHAPSGLVDFEPPPGAPSEHANDQREWQSAVAQAAALCRGRGHLPAILARRIEELVTPRTDPMAVLREWLTDRSREDYNFLRPSPRFADSGFFCPGLDSPKAGRVIFATDTSGSIDAGLLARMRGLKQWVLDELHPTALVDIYCDARVQHVREYEPGDEIGPEAPGGGGTSFLPVFAYLEDPTSAQHLSDEARAVDTSDIRALVCLTDLDGTFPEAPPPYPVVWITWDPRRTAPFGDLIRIDL